MAASPVRCVPDTDSAAVSALLETIYPKRKLRRSDAADIAARLVGNKCAGSAAALGHI